MLQEKDVSMRWPSDLTIEIIMDVQSLVLEPKGDNDGKWVGYHVGPPYDSEVGANNSNFTMVYGT